LWPPHFKLDQVDAEFLHEQHLDVRIDTINISLELIHNTVRISDTPGGGFNLTMG
jgi:hypothetical protein